MQEPQSSGLRTSTQASIPLTGVHVEATITGRCSQVTITQRYTNRESVDVEAVYVFPLEEGSAICNFAARVGDRLIKGVLQEKQKAFETYDAAMEKGHGAFLLEQERNDLFTASVGNLRPGETLEIQISYVAQLNYEGQAIRLRLPMTVVPRYTPGEVTLPEAEVRPLPPMVMWPQVPYGLDIVVHARIKGGIKGLSSPSHPIQIRFEDEEASVSLSQSDVRFEKDFLLLIEPKAPHQPFSSLACEDDGTRIVMLNFYPDPDGLPIHPCEILFLLDCSGSMSGDAIEQARRALGLCLRALSDGDFFTIIRFGSHFESVWSEAQPYNEVNLLEASAYLQASDADLGGTEILAPLQAIFAQPTREGYQRQILILTDGAVSNESEVIALCRKNSAHTRIFSFGIGDGVSEHLVREVARASRGAAEFIASGERIEGKVLRMFGRIHSPYIDNPRIDWGEMLVEQAPEELPPIFAGEALTVFGRITEGHAPAASLKSTQQTWSIPLDLERAEKQGPIPVLWAQAMIRHLERPSASGSQQERPDRKDRKKEQIIELSKRYKLMSSHTSFVAVEIRQEEEKSLGPAVLRPVPTAEPQKSGQKMVTIASASPLTLSAVASASSPPGVGATFFVGGSALPPAPPPPPGPSSLPSAPPPPAKPSPKMRGAPPKAALRSAGFGGQSVSPAPAPKPSVSGPGGGGYGGAGQGSAAGNPAPPMSAAGEPSPMPDAKAMSTDKRKKKDLPPQPAAPSGSKGRLRREAEPFKSAKFDGASMDSLLMDAGEGSAAGMDMEMEEDESASPLQKESSVLAPEPLEDTSVVLSQTEAAFKQKPPSDEGSFYDLLMSQKADGSFPLTAILRRLVAPKASALAVLLGQHPESLVATALALALLRTRFAAFAEEWKIPAQKAQRWLSSQPPCDVSSLL